MGAALSKCPPHVILTLGRSGSNTLVDILNQNPEILNFSEVLGDWTVIRRFKYLVAGFSHSENDYFDHILRDGKVAVVANFMRSLGKIRTGRRDDIKALSRVRTIGVKDFSLNFQGRGLVEHLLAQEDILFIGLVRRNTLERYISNVRLEVTKEVLTRDGATSKDFRPELNPATLVDELHNIQREQDDLDAMLARVPPNRKYVIDYEDLYSDPERTRDIALKAFSFLGVSPIEPAIRMKKLIQKPMREVIANFEESRAAVVNTPFERFFV